MVISVHPSFANEDETIGASIADVFLIHEDHAESLSLRSYDITYLDPYNDIQVNQKSKDVEVVNK